MRQNCQNTTKTWNPTMYINVKVQHVPKWLAVFFVVIIHQGHIYKWNINWMSLVVQIVVLQSPNWIYCQNFTQWSFLKNILKMCDQNWHLLTCLAHVALSQLFPTVIQLLNKFSAWNIQITLPLNELCKHKYFWNIMVIALWRQNRPWFFIIFFRHSIPTLWRRKPKHGA